MVIATALANVQRNLAWKNNEKPAIAINPAQEGVIYMLCVSDIIASGKKKK
jgi:hypothetical protein